MSLIITDIDYDFKPIAHHYYMVSANSFVGNLANFSCKCSNFR